MLQVILARIACKFELIEQNLKGKPN